MALRHHGILGTIDDPPAHLSQVERAITADTADSRRPEIRAGTSFVDTGGIDVHMLRDDASAPAETIAVQFIPSGLTRRIDKPAPTGCPA